jgi:hypothetical protein
LVHWLGRYHQRLAEVQRQLHRFSSTLGLVANITNATARTAAARSTGVAALTNFSRAYEQMMESLLSFTTTQGELGMVAMQEGMNFQASMVRTGFLGRLGNLTQQPLPREALPSREYTGAARVFVLTLRTLLLQAEPALSVPIVALAPARLSLPAFATISWHALGASSSDWTNVSAARVARSGWYNLSLSNPGTDFEYFVQLTLTDAGADGGDVLLRYPAAGAVQVVLMKAG